MSYDIHYGYFKLFRVRSTLLSLLKYIQNKKKIMTSTLDFEKNKNRGGRPLSSIWEDIARRSHISSGKYQATCKYCNFSWSRGDVSKLEEHLANHCSEAPASVVRRYLSKVLEREDKTNKKKENCCQ